MVDAYRNAAKYNKIKGTDTTRIRNNFLPFGIIGGQKAIFAFEN